MKISFACDHGGFPIRNAVIAAIRDGNHELLDFGIDRDESVDYPDFVSKAAYAVKNGLADRAIVCCGSGIGACITANKIKGVYASVCHDTYSARQGVEHDKMNVLCLGGRVVGTEVAYELTTAFLNATFSAQERHLRRFNKMIEIENRG